MKQVILICQDLKLPKGKMAAQAAHAAVECSLRADRKHLKQWHAEGQKKVVLKVKDEKELYKYIQTAKDMGLTTCVISDAGRTVVEPGTVTCGGIGPNAEMDIDSITGELKMM